MAAHIWHWAAAPGTWGGGAASLGLRARQMIIPQLWSAGRAVGAGSGHTSEASSFCFACCLGLGAGAYRLLTHLGAGGTVLLSVS